MLVTTPIYAVGDIHGQIHQLNLVLEQISADGGENAEIVFLGDYVDRGPDSRAVIETLLQGVASGRPWHVLRGNHDRMFCRFVRDGIAHDDRIKSGKSWFHSSLGGIASLASFGVEAADTGDWAHVHKAAANAVPNEHLEFLESRPLTLERDGLLFVHAGIMPGVALADQDEDDLIWIRDPFLIETAPHPWLVVHGHTALDAPFHFGNRIDLDGGAGYGRPLTAAVFEGTSCWLLAGNGRIQLVP